MSTNDREGLTKPLINNVGGMDDQDAPSADQLLEGRGNTSWDDTTVVREGSGDRSDVAEPEDSGFIASPHDALDSRARE